MVILKSAGTKPFIPLIIRSSLPVIQVPLSVPRLTLATCSLLAKRPSKRTTAVAKGGHVLAVLKKQGGVIMARSNSDPPGKECPLNVCCSAFGFCGMTDEFCQVTDDEETSCQSNCDQPGSGKTGGDVRKRVVGYYEAWVNDRACNGMSIDQIPVGALTHLMFSFGYITPGDFQVVPMDDLDPSLFNKMAALKRKNKALKVMVALGGWTFNDPGPTQQVFHDVASSKANRSKFITNLLSFLRQYAFDGVDFDWEYPGADDRGGSEEDGENFTSLIKELKEAIANQPIEYVVSFTTPTSYWYLRHFDIKGSADAADFVNIMSYDLHGIWDSWNPIGSNVLAHSNLTEIKLALDLYWRNDVPPEKLNLGLGFYGRSFQLTDPSCFKPGCQFRGGASPGSCTKNSGTLAYREIVDIIDKKKLKPYYEKEHAVKYIVWDQDQWVSYDDEETIEAKIKFANDQGLGGVLIWSVDQDTDDLKALSAVVGRNNIALALKIWQDIGDQSCYTTDCGGHCKSGFKKVTSQPCGGAQFLTRHSTEDDSELCCPLTSFPDPDECTWRGEAPSCNGRCHDGEALLELNRWGSGKYCEDGNKAYCCSVPQGKNNDCYWSGMGQDCRNGDQPLTFAGTFLSDIADVAQFFGLVGQVLSEALDDADMALKEKYCCPPEDLDTWKNCEWKGEPGSCFDNHCDANTQVQLTTNRYGFGESCSPRLERARVFCCDPPDGETLFLPVPLEDLFPNPPTGDDVDTDFDLNIDNTWGDGQPDTGTDDDPDEAAFQFYVLAAPDEIQTSLDKRDGSHWDVFNCNDAVSEETHTVQMVCTDVSEESNCDHIRRGHGVPGTILQMPKGCGPGKYAVAVDMAVSKNQSLPQHIRKRKLHHNPIIYDLTFDYDFSRVPRDFGETQMRVDFSNQEGYWDNVVAAAASKKHKVKRSLQEVNGNHRRWLEEEWRDDMHYGALSRDDLHKRWFGSDVLDWLGGLLNINIKKEKRHDYEEDISVIILQEDWTCERPNTKFQAKLDAVATASLKMSSSFGFTLITTLRPPPLDLSKSFLHFDNEGIIEAIFTIDALARVDWDSKDFPLGPPIPFPGGSFKIPGIMTIGPELILQARLKAGIKVEGHVEARVTLADWDIRQTYPQQTDQYDPKTEDPPKRDMNNQGLLQPTFDASVEASGYVEAHLMPTISFGIDFADYWQVGRASADLVADGWVRMRAKSDLVGGDCAFGYGIDAGVVLLAQATAPDYFDWHPEPLPLGRLEGTIVPKEGEWECLTADNIKRTIDAPDHNSTHSLITRSSLHSGLNKRLVPYGPVIKLPSAEKLCPSKGGAAGVTPCSQTFAVDGMYADADDISSFTRRSSDYTILNVTESDAESLHLHQWVERLRKTPLSICDGDAKMLVKFPEYDTNGDIYDNANWGDCNNYEFGKQTAMQNVLRPSGRNERYVVEHVLEAQLMQRFFKDVSNGGADSVCKRLKAGGFEKNTIINNEETYPIYHVASGYPSTSTKEEMMYIIEPINLIKENIWKGNRIPGENNMAKAVATEDAVPTAIRSMKNALMTYKYMMMKEVGDIMVKQTNRVGDKFDEAEKAMVDANRGYVAQGLSTRWKSYVKGQFSVVMGKLDTFVGDWMPKIEKVLEDTDPAQDSPDRKELRTRIEKLREAVDNTKGTWTNPLP
ncbi:family 18 glycosyl hydrolase [Hypoxylon cercidicola]|nr:family 18 glycosyl hydrolase [Hypoxylon cercidicola]